MQERIVVNFDCTVAPVDVHGFRDVLLDVLAEQGASALEVDVLKVPLDSLNGQPVSVEWHAAFKFYTPDGKFFWSDQNLKATVTGKAVDHGLLMTLLAKRHLSVCKAYRSVLQGLFKLSRSIAAGEIEITQPPVDYLSATLEAALAELPNTN